jgi:hypothetical protein
MFLVTRGSSLITNKQKVGKPTDGIPAFLIRDFSIPPYLTSERKFSIAFIRDVTTDP